MQETIQLQQRLARVQSLLDAARRIHSSIRLDDVLSGVLELAAKELEARGSCLGFGDAQNNTRVYGQVPDHWTPEGDWAGAPMTVTNGCTDTIGQLMVFRPEPLSLEEQDFLEGLALQSALAIRNARQHECMMQWERVQRDLEAARGIERSLLPQTASHIPGYSLSFRSTPCYEVGGDYIDIMPTADGSLMLVVADVAGKGLASAMISMIFRSSFRAICGTGLPLAEMAERLNTLHWAEGAEARTRYVTAILVRVNPGEHTIEAINAGHAPAFLLRRGASVKISASGPPLGMFPHQHYESEVHYLDEGSRLLLYTDGLTDIENEEEEFGERRLLELIEALPVADTLDRLWAALTSFAGTARQTDDMTALHLFRAPGAGPS